MAIDYKKEFEDLIEKVIKENASDLHLSDGRYPTIRVAGFLIPLMDRRVLTVEDTAGFMGVILKPDDRALFQKTKEIDFSYDYKGQARFRGNGFFQQGTVSFALRLIPKKIKNFEDLNLPPILETFCQKQQGFFLVVGPVGHGKTTTLAAMLEHINQTRAEHIVTIEDPIEYIYEQKKSVVDQREVRVDTLDFAAALRSVFRQDVDVILVGEMRGNETMATAVTAAETGHLVLSTIHTNNAAQTINRIIDSFPAAQQDQIRIQLASTLTGIFSQRLIPRISGGLIPAYELLIANSAVSNLIREKRIHEINTVIETGLEQGMIDMNRSLAELVRKGEITAENAYLYSPNPKILERLM
ncbi:MAG: type IV pili twitching motility protein PilT [Candidatus Taylorbacteria bacterium CG10_big_fil_rev_8_21_14_0_10_41_48]|uniref:Type IV pili twitching motility protein PilT n=1 Tax=Candidatus Taylorbacteria bacterium CG10_big_fil_rev_8_21_14_0_10_41_48 TaxID=1975024 RepID=A0A2M8LC26_9BACT|nr:MAG: type IV pili twitching motility protein PilT [Candidatus Taylorbacteria bacterium CG10_big_fil_rev_8_21_14_0_10_41_48]